MAGVLVFDSGHRRKTPLLRTLVVFALLWPPTGFALGTATLLGPVRWVTNATREAGFSPLSERAIVLMIMVGLLGSSALLGLILAQRILEARDRRGTVGIPMVVALAASFALWAWFTPALLNRGATVEVLDGSRFTFGPYPEQAQLEELAEAGYTHIISLLHPGVVPFEPILLSRERDNVARAGLEFVHAPMLPWVGNNEASLALIQELVEGDSGRYYVHCYLGRDRVGVVRRLVSGLSAIVMETSGDLHPLAQLDHFERGGVERIGDNLFLTPFPTDEEMLAFFLNEQTAQVVSLLDPEVEANRSFMEHEREQLALVGVPLVELPLTQQATPGELLSAAEAIGRLEGVTILHRFRSDDPVSRALAKLLKADRS